jgi:hypothetical protein
MPRRLGYINSANHKLTLVRDRSFRVWFGFTNISLGALFLAMSLLVTVQYVIARSNGQSTDHNSECTVSKHSEEIVARRSALHCTFKQNTAYRHSCANNYTGTERI